MKVRYIGRFADDGVELADGRWFDGNVDTDVDEETAVGLLAQAENWEPADDEARALLAPIEPAQEPAPPAPPAKASAPVTTTEPPAGPAAAPTTSAPTTEVTA